MSAAPAVPLSSPHSAAAEGVNSIALRDDGRLLATAGWDHRVRLFRLRLLHIASSAAQHTQQPQPLLCFDAVSSSSSSVVHRIRCAPPSSLSDSSEQLRAVQSLLCALFASSPPLDLLVVLPFHSAPVQAVAFAPAGNQLEEEQEGRYTDRLWKAEEHTPGQQLQPRSSPASTSFASAASLSSPPATLLPFSRLSSLRASSISARPAWASRPADAAMAVPAVGSAAARPSMSASSVAPLCALLASASEDQRIACWTVPLHPTS